MKKKLKQEIDISKYIVGIDPYDKQETLEEAFKFWSDRMSSYDKLDILRFGALWQQEQDKNKYSEEEVLELLLNRPGPYLKDNEIKEWFKQNKK